MSPESSPPLGLPEDSWLKGYFQVIPEADVRGGSREAVGCWKNLDFMRLRDVALHILDPCPGMKVLDIGCANGSMMVYCGLQGAAAYGQDLDASAVDLANKTLARFGIAGEARVGDVAKLDFPDNFFDAAVSSDFFEHITDDAKVGAFREALRVLKPGASLVIKTPNLSYLRVAMWYKRLRALARLRSPARIVIPHTPGTDEPDHIGLTTRRGMGRALIAAGFVNFRFHYAPLRRFGYSIAVEMLSTEIPFARDLLCEDLFCQAIKPIALSHFPD